MKLFVHIGSHKTGTTAIQHYSAAHREELSDQGLLYPSFEKLGRRPGRSHLALVSGLQGLRRPNVPSFEESLSFLHMTRDEAIARGNNILFSAENIFRLKARSRSRLFELLLGSFPDFEVVPVVALRRQDNLADSLYRNSIRSEADLSRNPATWPDFLAEQMPLFDYSRILQDAQLAFGRRPVVLAYAGHLRKNTVPSFFERLGVDVQDPADSVRRVNASYDFLDCQVKRHLAETGGTDRLFRLLERFVKNHPLRSRYSFFSETFRPAFLSQFRAGNAQLVADFPELESVLADNIPADFPVAGDGEAAQDVGRRWADYAKFVAELGFHEQLPRPSHRQDCVETFKARQAVEDAEVLASAWTDSARKTATLS
ncbi:MAG: hypothetical protein WBG57_10450 [Ornithinimicrobium sp.]